MIYSKKLFTYLVLLVGITGSAIIWSYVKPKNKYPNKPFNKATVSLSEPIDVVIVGGGIAGMSAAIPTTEHRKKTMVFQGTVKGGQLNKRTPVGNWSGIKFSSGDNIVKNLEEQITRNGAIISDESITDINVNKQPFTLTTSHGKTVQAKTIILATGSTPKQLDYAEDFIGKSAFFDADQPAILKDKCITVIGGGDDAIRQASQALRHGAKSVTIICRSSLTAAAFRQERILKNPALKIMLNTQVGKVIENKNAITHLNVIDNQGIKTTIPTDILLIAAGRIPNTNLVKNKIATDKQGYIITSGPNKETNIKGIFAAGAITQDFNDAGGQGLIAAAQGMSAGYGALNYL